MGEVSGSISVYRRNPSSKASENGATFKYIRKVSSDGLTALDRGYRLGTAFARHCFLLSSTLCGWVHGQSSGATSAQIYASATEGLPRLENCGLRRVSGLPGSHHFASDFIEAIAGSYESASPGPRASSQTILWGLTADLSNLLPVKDQALYISRSSDGGASWVQIARIDSRYFDADIGEGLRNGLTAALGGKYFVITTQRGAFQVTPQGNPAQSLIEPIPGPRVPESPAKVLIAKHTGDAERGDAVQMTADGNHLFIGFGYFDLEPHLLSYHKAEDGSWMEDDPLPPLPTQMDVLSMQFNQPESPNPEKLYVGTGDQAYVLDLHTHEWSRVQGVGADSAIHGMSITGGLHLAACWSIYNPVDQGTVWRVVNARFLLHRNSDEAGSNIRAYGIDVDPADYRREAVASLTGVYVSENNGESWRRLNGLPEEEFRTVHFNADGRILVSGIAGTFLVNPFAPGCLPQLKTRRPH